MSPDLVPECPASGAVLGAPTDSSCTRPTLYGGRTFHRPDMAGHSFPRPCQGALRLLLVAPKQALVPERSSIRIQPVVRLVQKALHVLAAARRA